jgi:5-formyltetrahydrofolate cyclo-ligase
MASDERGEDERHAAVMSAKKALRSTALETRARVLAGRRDALSAAIARNGIAFATPADGAAVAGFASMADEIDTAPLLSRLDREGFALALPVMRGKAAPLLFRAYRPGDAMGSGRWGIAEPLPERPERTPDVLLVPLLAFDAQGRRLGYGGGYYDRTIADGRLRRKIVTIGVALDELEVDAVPTLEYDEPLDWVTTPTGWRRLGR